MSKICSKCGKEYDDTGLKCPYCGEDYNATPKIDEILEVPSIESITPPVEEVSNTELLPSEATTETPIVPPINEIEPTPVTTEESAVNAEVVSTTLPKAIPVESETTPLSPTVETLSQPEVVISNETPSTISETTPIVEEKTMVEQDSLPDPSPVVNAEMPVIEATKLDNILPASLDENHEDVVENSNLETVSIETTNEALEEKLEIVEIPEMPAPMVDEINPDLLGNKYEAEEQQNMAKLEARRKQEEAELERKRQEEAAKSQIPMEKPDLLARTSDPDGEIEVKPKKRKGKGMKRLMNILILILGATVIAAAVWYFINQNKESSEESSYMNPINTYFTGYKEADSTKMLSSFVPCIAKSDEITSLITNTVQTRTQYSEISLEYEEKTTEVVNINDQANLDDYLKTTCGTDIPKITEYKHIYVNQKIKTEQDKEYTENNPEFWTVKIDGQWYILLVQ